MKLSDHTGFVTKFKRSYRFCDDIWRLLKDTLTSFCRCFIDVVMSCIHFVDFSSFFLVSFLSASDSVDLVCRVRVGCLFVDFGNFIHYFHHEERILLTFV